MPKRPYSECTPTLTDYPQKVQRTERREDDTDVVDILAGVSSYLRDGLEIPLVIVDGRRVFGRATVSNKQFGSRLFRVTNPVCGKTPGYTTYIYRSLSLHPFFDAKDPYSLSSWNCQSQKDVSIVKVEIKVPYSYYSLPRTASNLLLFHQVAQHKVDAKAEREICDVLLIAAENPEIYPLRWMTAMKVALLYKPFDRQAVLSAIARATRRHVRYAKAMAVTTQEQFQALCDDVLVGAVFCEVGDKRQTERKHVLWIVGERMKRKADVDTIIADANAIVKSGSTSSPWVKHLQQLSDALDDLRPSLALNGYQEVLQNLDRHPIQESLHNIRDTRDTLFITLRAGAELGWPKRVTDMLDTVLRSGREGVEGFEKSIATPIHEIKRDRMMSQSRLSRSALRDTENAILIQAASGGSPPIALVQMYDGDGEDAEMSTLAHESSFSDSNPEVTMGVENSSRTPIDNNTTSSTVDSHAAVMQSSGTGVPSSSMGSATNTGVEATLLGTWAQRPLALLRADYARVELIIGNRENHVYKTTTRVTSTKAWRAHQAEIAQSLDGVAGGSEPWRGSPLKNSHTPDCLRDGCDDEDAAKPSARPMPKRVLVAENNALARLYHNIWHKSLAAIEAEVASRERVLFAHISEQAEVECDAMEL
ncbi:hypothetical protein PENSPDRAFT_755883 [Peniophora sp. CONT]|nr:hypothetical protein PENSPDRAFT_755883 [Peniophora sp. CONT]